MLLLLLSAALLVPVVVVFIQIMCTLLQRGSLRAASTPPARVSRLAVVMPAHNEAGGIATSIASVMSQLAPGDRLVVVADNCTDNTSQLARSAGAEVIERYDNERRGKGYALDFGVRWLENDPPGVVVFIDADCTLASHALAHLASCCDASSKPIQALYLMQAPAQGPVRLRIAQFAWVVKNKSRPLGSAALGAPCQLMGSGMAFPWHIVKSAPLASGHLVEDMQLGLELARDGNAPVFCPQAVILTSFPSEQSAAEVQRTRWEHGHLSMLASQVPWLLWQAIRRRDIKLAAMGLDLMVPPVAALALAVLLTLLTSCAWWAADKSSLALTLSLLSACLLFTAVATAWLNEGRQIISGAELFGVPFYVAAKIPIYLKLFTKRQVDWVRTKREK